MLHAVKNNDHVYYYVKPDMFGFHIPTVQPCTVLIGHIGLTATTKLSQCWNLVFFLITFFPSSTQRPLTWLHQFIFAVFQFLVAVPSWPEVADPRGPEIAAETEIVTRKWKWEKLLTTLRRTRPKGEADPKRESDDRVLPKGHSKMTSRKFDPVPRLSRFANPLGRATLSPG